MALEGALASDGPRNLSNTDFLAYVGTLCLLLFSLDTLFLSSVSYYFYVYFIQFLAIDLYK